MLQAGKYYKLHDNYCECRLTYDKHRNQVFELVDVEGNVARMAQVDEIVPGIRQVSQAEFAEAKDTPPYRKKKRTKKYKKEVATEPLEE